MSETDQAEQIPPGKEPAEPTPAFDIAEARARYRRQMRSRPMKIMFGLSLLILMCTWVLGGAAALAPDVERLPGHDLSVTRDLCVDCHTRQLDVAPAFNHSFAPTCGFCHRQAAPTPSP